MNLPKSLKLSLTIYLSMILIQCEYSFSANKIFQNTILLGNSKKDITDSKKVSVHSDIDRLIADGNIDQSIPLLENELLKAKENKDIFLEAKILSQLQFAHYCKGGFRRSLIIGQQLSDLLAAISKQGIADERIASLIADNTLLYMYTEIERGYHQNIKERINDFVKDQGKAISPKIKAKFFLGLAYGYYLDENHKLYNENLNKFRRIYQNIDELDVNEDLQLIFAYIKATKEFNSNGQDDYKNGVDIITRINQKHGAKAAIINSFALVNIAALYFFEKEYNKSSSTLGKNLQNIERIPSLFRYLTWDILGDNATAKKDFSLAKQYYTTLDDTLFKGNSETIPQQFHNRVRIKLIRTNYLLTQDMSREDITVLLAFSNGLDIGTFKDIQRRINDLSNDSITLQKLLVSKNLIWEAFTVSEATRSQITRRVLDDDDRNSFSSAFNQDLGFYSRKPSYSSRLSLNYEIAGNKDTMFPISILSLANSFRNQNLIRINDGYTIPSHIVKTSKSTVIEYAYDFKNDRPKEIYVYILKPQTDIKRMEPIIRCINLDVSSISSFCKDHSRNSMVSVPSWNKKKISIDKLGFKEYVRRNLNNIINCRPGEISRQNACDSQKNTDQHKTYESLQALHQLLIEPIADLLPSDSNEKVVFIPQGELFSIPFTALQDNQGKYLIEKHTLSIAPSLSLLGRSSDLYVDNSRNKTNEILIVGNPSISKELNLPSLPFSEKEARTLGQIYGANPLIGNEATEEAILKGFAKARIIHLATHGTVNREDSLSNNIILAPTSTNPKGIFLAKDIPKNTVELVILSACNSGKGNISTDGVAGFSTQLILSGNPSQIVSLWLVNDGSTSQIMINFHRALLRGESKTHALREAMLKTMKTDKYKDPYYWAPFTLIGNTQ
jgi:CHAT domain-containing protein